MEDEASGAVGEKLQASPALPLDLTRADQLEGRPRSIATSGEDVFVSYWDKVRIDAFEPGVTGGVAFKWSYECGGWLKRVRGLFVLNDFLYFWGSVDANGSSERKVMKVDSRDRYGLVRQFLYGGSGACGGRFRVAGCQPGTVIVSMFDRVDVLSEEGDCLKTVFLSPCFIGISEAVQIDDWLFVANNSERLLLFEDSGDLVLEYTPPSSEDWGGRRPYRLAYDGRRGELFVGFYYSRKVLVFDRGLGFKTSQDLGEFRMIDFYLDPKRDALVVLTGCNKVLTFKLQPVAVDSEVLV